jgi:replication factor A2
MNSYSQGEKGFFSQGQGGGFRKDTKQSLRPVTIKQLTEAVEPRPENDTYVDGTPVDRIKFVALIRDISDNPTTISYKVDDGTGTIEVRKWVDSSRDGDTAMGENPAQPFIKDQYISGVGTVRVFNNKRSINAHHLAPVTDYNEVIYHQIEALAVHLSMTSGAKSAGNTVKQADEDSLFTDRIERTETRIIKHLESFGEDSGLTAEEIAHSLGIEEYETRRLLSTMDDAGHVYTTDGVRYFKS